MLGELLSEKLFWAIQLHPDLAGTHCIYDTFACGNLACEICVQSRDCNVDLRCSVKLLLLLYRPPMQTTSEQAKPAATMNTCGAMMVGSNQSKDAINDGECSSLLCGFFAPRYGLCRSNTSWPALHSLLGSNSRAWHSCLTGLLPHNLCCK